MIKSDDFENMIKLYPVNYKGYWFNVDEIDNPLPQELLSGDGRIDAEIKEQFTQQFYNQIIYAYIYNLQQFLHNNGFYCIIKHANALCKAKDNVKKLHEREDYDKRIARAISYSCIDMDAPENYPIKDLILNPDLFDGFFQKEVVLKFNEDVEHWNKALSSYKQKRAYINRLNYLKEQMDILDGVNISYIKDSITKQKDLYNNLLEK